MRHIPQRDMSCGVSSIIHRRSVNEFLRNPGSQSDVATYIAAMAKELAEMASGCQMPLLRYLLEMAQDEALSISRQQQDIREAGE